MRLPAEIQQHNVSFATDDAVVYHAQHSSLTVGGASLGRRAGVAVSLSGRPPKDVFPAQNPTVLVAIGLLIERPQGVHDLVEAHR